MIRLGTLRRIGLKLGADGEDGHQKVERLLMGYHRESLVAILGDEVITVSKVERNELSVRAKIFLEYCKAVANGKFIR